MIDCNAVAGRQAATASAAGCSHEAWHVLRRLMRSFYYSFSLLQLKVKLGFMSPVKRQQQQQLALLIIDLV